MELWEIILFRGLGGIIPIWLLSLLFGRLFFKEMETTKKINYSTLVAYIAGIILSGFGRMDGAGITGFSPAYIEYLLSAILVILLRQGISKLRDK
tara:strand:+ start:1144 stop:1428 length:285 start_codon:yes stop_codon:yes gene_type:complete